jgi:hypothetical protein
MGWHVIGLKVHSSFIKFTKRGVIPHPLIDRILTGFYGLEQGCDFHISQSERPGEENYLIVIPKRYALHFTICFDDLLNESLDMEEAKGTPVRYMDSLTWRLLRRRAELKGR